MEVNSYLHTKANKKETMKRYGLAIAFISPFLILFLVYTIIPLFIGIGISFFKYNPYNPDAKEFIGFQYYIRIFSGDVVSKTFWTSFGKTMLFAIVAVPCLILIPLGLAILINHKPPGYKVFRSIIYLPSVVSVSIAGVLFITIFGETDTSLINALLGTNIKFLTNEPLRWFVMLLLSIWWQTGTNFVILSAALRDVPKSLYEACEVDGGGKKSSFLHVTLPNIKGSLSLCIFNTLIGYMNLYGQPVAIHGSTNATNIESPMMLIQSWLTNITYANLVGYISAVAVFFGLIVMCFSLLERWLMSREKGGRKYEEKFSSICAIEK